MRFLAAWRALLLLLLGLALVAGLGGRPPAAQPAKPNVVFILADDMGWGDLGCTGHPLLRTPNLDRLARQGTLFTQFTVNAPVCSPSRAAFLTGQFPGRNRVHGHFATAKDNEARGMPGWLDPALPTLPRQLRRAGYRTAQVGKWHLGNIPEAPDPGAYGYDHHRSQVANRAGWDKTEAFFHARSAEHFVDEAVRFIAADRSRPFYLQLWMLLPHGTLHPTPEQFREYHHLAVDDGVPYRSAQQIYYASVTEMDRQVGRLLAKLDALKLAENTVVIFTSDNGPEDIEIDDARHSGVGSPGPFRGRKRSLYEGGIRVPLIVRWPGVVPAGRVDDTSVLTAVDFFPTLCRLAGAPLPAGHALDGEDVGEALAGRPFVRGKPIMWEWRFEVVGHVLNRSPMLAIREGRWKLLLNPDRSRVELYDLARDRSELNNLADREPEVVRRLSREALAWARTLPPGPADPSAGRNDYPWPGSPAAK